MDWPFFAIFGFCVGMLVGTTGVGGGTLMTPGLILIFNMHPAVAIGTDLAYAAVTKTLGGWRHLRAGTVNRTVAGWLIVGSVPGAIVGVIALKLLESTIGDSFGHVVLVLVAGALLLTGGMMLARALLGERFAARERDSFAFRRSDKISAVAIGGFVGIVLAMTSAGSGALVAIALVAVYRLRPHTVVGTSIFQAAVLLWVAAVGHLFSGHVDFGLTGALLLGSLPGVWLGSSLSVRIPQDALRHVLALVLLAAGLALLDKGGVNIPDVLVFALPGALALAAVTLELARRRSRPAPHAPADRRPAARPGRAHHGGASGAPGESAP